MVYQVGICDDSEADRNYIQDLARQWGNQQGHTLHIRSFASGEEFLFHYAEHKDFDILLLDIEMGAMDGVTMARKLRRENDTVQIVFVTGYSDYISEGYEVEALHYLMKPVKPEKLFSVLDRAAEKLSKNERVLCLESGGEMVRIPVPHIRYAEVYGNYVTIHARQAHTVRMTLGELEGQLDTLRQGMFAPKNRGKLVETTEEGIAVSMNLLNKGYVADEEIERFPGVTHQKGIHPVIECTQNIPCNPCQDACKMGCIRIGRNITSLPAIDPDKKCVGCGMCVASCSGQSIFLVEEDVEEGYGEVTMPYEFLPLPKVGDRGIALGRNGKYVCDAEVTKIRTAPVFDHTYLLTIKVPNDMVMKARFYKKEMAKEA